MKKPTKIRQKNTQTNLPLVLAPVAHLVLALLVVMALIASGRFPAGADAYYHVYRGNHVLEAIREGVWFPLLDMNWYNGVELLRFQSPLSAYLLALCQFLAGGEVANGYLVYIALLVVGSGLPWLYIGRKEHRPWMGAALGLLWFFMPANLLALFSEGDLAKGLALTLVPLFFYLVWSYMAEPLGKTLAGITVLATLLGMIHINFYGHMLAALLLFLVIYGIATRRYMRGVEILLTLLLVSLLQGVWIVPYLFSDVPGVDVGETAATFYQSLGLSLNPLYRLGAEGDAAYYGLALCVVALLGVFFSEKEQKGSFIAALLLLVGSATSMYVVVRLISGGEGLRMVQLFPVATALVFLGLLRWRKLRRGMAVLVCGLFVLDLLPSLPLVMGTGVSEMPEARLEQLAKATLLKEAKEITTQRLALMDASSLGPEAVHYLSGQEDPVALTFGLKWQDAATSANIYALNRSLHDGHYLYLFDRALELGNDTILLRLSEAATYMSTENDIILAAAQVGYTLVKEVYDYLLFHYETVPTEGFGTTAHYRYLAMGSGAQAICMAFPAFMEADSEYLDDYSLEELKQYEILYLAGFNYHEREVAEQLVSDLTEAGVRVVIAADGIPDDRRSHARSFLDVHCNDIVFSNGYPELDTLDGIMNTDLFPRGYTTWKTVYMEGLQDVWGTVLDNDIALPFYGTGKNKNIIYIGINLTFFYSLTNDPSVGELLSHAFHAENTELPARSIVPVTCETEGNCITLKTVSDGVYTGLADHDIFTADRVYQHRHHQIVVGEGETILTLHYPYKAAGILTSVGGLCGLVAFVWLMNREHRKKKEEV